MFFWWVISTKILTNIAKTFMLETFSWYKNMIKTGNAKPAKIELKDTNLVKNKLIIKTKTHKPAAGK